MFWIFTTFLREFSVGPDGSAASEMLDALPPQVNHVLVRQHYTDFEVK